MSVVAAVQPVVEAFERLGIAYHIVSAEFVCRGGEYDRESLARFVERSLTPGSRAFKVATAEDILLRKLEWYRDGGEVSDRQWADVLGIIRLRERDLDRAYLEHWAVRLGIDDLLARAEHAAGEG